MYKIKKTNIFYKLPKINKHNCEIDTTSSKNKIIHRKDDIKMLRINDNVKNINNVFINFDLTDDPDIHLLYFLNKNIYVNYHNNKQQLNKIIANPIVKGIYDTPSDFKIEVNDSQYQNDIINTTCFINVNEILKSYDDHINQQEIILVNIQKVWGSFLIYSVYNLPYNIIEHDECLQEFYEKLASTLGTLHTCHPVNNKNTSFSQSRDIRYKPNTNNFFSSNARQPFHTDYAYYPVDICPDWLMLYSLEQCEFGGFTSLLTTKKLQEIMIKYNNELYQKIVNKKINYQYEDIERGTIIHEKNLFSDDAAINWNYFQIRDSINDEETIQLRDDFFNFLEKQITDGQIWDVRKKWNRGDAIIFNDHYVLHQRSAFLGNRWLKDHAFSSSSIAFKYSEK